MNKLVLESNINNVEDGEYILEYNSNTHINVLNSVILHNYHIHNNNLTVKLIDSSSLVFNNFYVVTNDINIDISLSNDSYLEYNLLIINKGNNKVTINLSLCGNSNKCFINVKGINSTNHSRLDIIINGTIEKNTICNEFLENIKGFILNDDFIKISPNINALTSDCLANHLVTIGSYKEEDIFYLTSKGLDVKAAKKLILKGFLTSILSSPLKEYLKEEVISFE